MSERMLESMTKSDLVVKDEQKSWLSETVLKPSYDAGVVTPVNAVANIVNNTNHRFGGGDVLPKMELANYEEAKTLSPDWFIQNAVSGIVATAPYVVAGKFAGAGLRTGGSYLQLEGKAAAVVASDATAQMTGAALYDGSRDTNSGETHRGNAMAGATAFGIYAGLNPLARNIGFVGQIGARLGIGAVGASSAAVVSDLSSKGQLPDLAHMEKAMMTGAFMNVILPHAQAKIGAAVDAAETKLTGSMPLDRFVSQNNLDGSGSQPRSQSLALFGDAMALTRVRVDGQVGSRNSIAIDESLLSNLRSSDPAALDAARNKAASYLGEQLSAKYRANHGIPEGILSNNGIETALRQGRLQVYTRDANGVDQKIMPSADKIGSNGLDVHLDDEFVIVPKGQTIDLGARSPKDVLKDWPATKLSDGIVLQPGEFVLAFTNEKIALPAGPKPEWQGQPALVAEINSPSSIGRMGLETHQTAPIINNGTDNRITLEIVNNNPSAIRLQPGMKIASLVFRTMTGHPENSAQKSYFNGQDRPNGLRNETETISQPTVQSAPVVNREMTSSAAIAEASTRIPASNLSDITAIEALRGSALTTMSPDRFSALHDGIAASRQNATVTVDNAIAVPNEFSRPLDASIAMLGGRTGLSTITSDNLAQIHNQVPDGKPNDMGNVVSINRAEASPAFSAEVLPSGGHQDLPLSEFSPHFPERAAAEPAASSFLTLSREALSRIHDTAPPQQ